MVVVSGRNYVHILVSRSLPLLVGMFKPLNNSQGHYIRTFKICTICCDLLHLTTAGTMNNLFPNGLMCVVFEMHNVILRKI